MALRTLLLFACSLASLSYCQLEAFEKRNSSDLLGTCNKIAAAISGASQVFFPPTSEYLFDIEHATPASSETSACSVEPGCIEDVGEILRILGSTRTPFAVKGGGHATNPGYSSTTGVQISMTRFNKTNINSESGTVDVEAGLLWDDVYALLGPAGVTVIGARVPGIGVAGLTLGGGFSVLTSQYGLTLDNVAGYELVLPNGTVKDVTSKDCDLWFGLRGGMNNFGIVTKFILTLHPQGEAWGGVMTYGQDQLEAIKGALVNLQQKSDTKVEVIVTLTYAAGQVLTTISYFYDAPTPSSILDEFLAIPVTSGNVSTKSFYEVFQSWGFGVGGRRYFTEGPTVTHYSPAVFDSFVNQIKFWGPRLFALDTNATLGVALQPYDESMFSHGSDSAYPPDRSLVIQPTALTTIWSDPSIDETMVDVLRNISSTILAVALADGQNVSHAAIYPNYALFGTPLEDIYGGNVARLREIRRAIDPEDVMGLAGGIKF